MTAKILPFNRRRPPKTGGDKKAHCEQRPYPDRCDTCPAMAWPRAGCSREALADWVTNATCPHDYLSGPAGEW